MSEISKAELLDKKVRKELCAQISALLQQHEDEGITLRKIVEHTKEKGYKEQLVRYVLRLQEQSGEIFSDSDWKYHSLQKQKVG